MRTAERWGRVLCWAGLGLCMAAVAGSSHVLVRRCPNGEVRRFIQQYRPALQQDAPTLEVPTEALRHVVDAYEVRGRTLAAQQLILWVASGGQAAILLVVLLLWKPRHRSPVAQAVD